eukprot:CAMPEP_0178693810 /NCGR_PEP_ID=MMETSP0699-20121125/7908_1 /TAXON_ID=265572 /ORGANISM="Extubocellulus spinifer, Strain CCMP396" /LENGTH=758 /DNA_ID=CAMNT_0020339241 /DNA_START=182 /DNA_END=2458 /DNA_ORIENTATION=-
MARTRKRSRWDDAAATAAAPAAPPPAADPEEKKASSSGAEEDDNVNVNVSAAPPPAKKKTRTRKSRFSTLPATETAAASASAAVTAAPPPANTDGSSGSAVEDKKAKAAALQASISARLAALKARKAAGAAAGAGAGAGAGAATAGAGAATVPAPKDAAAATATTTTSSKGTKRARVYDLDLTDTTPLYKKQAVERKKNERKKKINPYLAHVEQPDDEDDGADILVGIGGNKKGLNANDVPDSSATTTTTTTSNSNDEILLDGRLTGGQTIKPRPHHRPLTFVQPGKYVAIAEKKRQKAINATASGFVSGRKSGTFVRSGGLALAAAGGAYGGVYGANDAGLPGDSTTLDNLPPRADAPNYNDEASRRDNTIPAVLEWWDVELLPVKLRREVAVREGRDMIAKARGTNDENDDTKNDNEEEEAERRNLEERCYHAASATNSKTYKLVQHIVPIKPPNAPTGPPKQPTLHLTKKEMKRQRKLRRAEKQRELQDMQAAGLLPPPEPRLTLSNFMRVLGDQAVMDPSQMEQKVTEQIQARKIKHERMNDERKLTRQQRKEKRARKLEEDTSQGVTVALYLVRDMSHRYHRTKVDLNAQQNGITGGVLEVERPTNLALVIAEGGPKAIKRYTRLMTVRMKWRGENFLGDVESDDDDNNEDGGGGGGDGNNHEDGGDDAPQKFNPNNSCELVWTGMGAKRMFNTFAFQKCETADVARKVLEAKGVAHFMDQVLVHASGRGSEFNFKLGAASANDDGDIEMGGA